MLITHTEGNRHTGWIPLGEHTEYLAENDTVSMLAAIVQNGGYRQAAKSLRIPKSTLLDYLKHNYKPSDKNQRKIAKAYEKIASKEIEQIEPLIVTKEEFETDAEFLINEIIHKMENEGFAQWHNTVKGAKLTQFYCLRSLILLDSATGELEIEIDSLSPEDAEEVFTQTMDYAKWKKIAYSAIEDLFSTLLEHESLYGIGLWRIGEIIYSFKNRNRRDKYIRKNNKRKTVYNSAKGKNPIHIE